MPQTIKILHFSPTGGARRVALLLAKGMAPNVREYDLCDPQAEPTVFHPDDVVLVAGPAYGGRSPAMMTGRLKKWQGNGARAVAAAVYGGRAYEDTLIELSDLLRGQGFRVMAAAALLAEHSIVHIAAGRPDEQDARQLGAFGRQIAAKLDHGSQEEPAVPGSHPYKEWSGMPAVPQVSEACTGCGPWRGSFRATGRSRCRLPIPAARQAVPLPLLIGVAAWHGGFLLRAVVQLRRDLPAPNAPRAAARPVHAERPAAICTIECSASSAAAAMTRNPCPRSRSLSSNQRVSS